VAIQLARVTYASNSKCATSLHGRKNFPVGSSISSSAEEAVIPGDAASPRYAALIESWIGSTMEGSLFSVTLSGQEANNVNPRMP
jgi:hypothetical protein